LDAGRLGEEIGCSSRVGYFEKIVLVEGHVGVREGWGGSIVDPALWSPLPRLRILIARPVGGRRWDARFVIWGASLRAES